MKDFVAVAGPLGVTHFLVFSKSTSSINFVSGCGVFLGVGGDDFGGDFVPPLAAAADDKLLLSLGADFVQSKRTDAAAALAPGG